MITVYESVGVPSILKDVFIPKIKEEIKNFKYRIKYI